jgi:hypothetical protein
MANDENYASFFAAVFDMSGNPLHCEVRVSVFCPAGSRSDSQNSRCLQLCSNRATHHTTLGNDNYRSGKCRRLIQEVRSILVACVFDALTTSPCTAHDGRQLTTMRSQQVIDVLKACSELDALRPNVGNLSIICDGLADSIGWDGSEAVELALPWSCISNETSAAVFVTNVDLAASVGTSNTLDNCLVVVKASSPNSVRSLVLDSDDGGLRARWARIQVQVQRCTAPAAKQSKTAATLCSMVREGTLSGYDEPVDNSVVM